MGTQLCDLVNNMHPLHCSCGAQNQQEYTQGIVGRPRFCETKAALWFHPLKATHLVCVCESSDFVFFGLCWANFFESRKNENSIFECVLTLFEIICMGNIPSPVHSEITSDCLSEMGCHTTLDPPLLTVCLLDSPSAGPS